MIDPLITAQALHAARDTAAHPLILDVRPAEQFAHGQIPGAVHLDLWGVSLIDTSPAPLKAFGWMIGHLFSLRGVTPERPVVVYEETSGPRAARVFWLLEYLGHQRAQVLDGGFASWRAHEYAIATDPAAPVASTWHGEPNPELVATWRDVHDRLGDDRVEIVDTRSQEEFQGTLVRAKRGGRIPGAVHLDWTGNLTPDGRFKPAGELRARYERTGVTPDKAVITYCQGGYRAAHAYLALRLLGFTDVRNYTGSWKEWGDREDLPIESGR